MECMALHLVKGARAITYLVAILKQDVVESIEMDGVTVGECAVNIEQDCLDRAQIRERSVARVGAHRDSSDLDGLCRSTIARHGDDECVYAHCFRWCVQCIGDVNQAALNAGIKEYCLQLILASSRGSPYSSGTCAVLLEAIATLSAGRDAALAACLPERCWSLGPAKRSPVVRLFVFRKSPHYCIELLSA